MEIDAAVLGGTRLIVAGARADATGCRQASTLWWKAPPVSWRRA
jgi:hypothetical protein